MKRIILSLVSVILLGVVGGYAQSANRKGFFVDVQAGNTFGYVYKSTDDDANGKPKEYVKGGFDIGMGLGMRFATSRHWAFQFKLATDINTSIVEATDLSLRLGMRWISNDFGGNKSAFVGLNTGFGVVPCASGVGPHVPLDVEAGVNLTNKLGLSLFSTTKMYILADWDYDWHDSYTDTRLQSNVLLGVRFNYRF